MTKHIFFELDFSVGKECLHSGRDFFYNKMYTDKLQKLERWIDVNHVYPKFLLQFVKEISFLVDNQNKFYERYRRAPSNMSNYFNWNFMEKWSDLGWFTYD